MPDKIIESVIAKEFHLSQPTENSVPHLLNLVSRNELRPLL